LNWRIHSPINILSALIVFKGLPKKENLIKLNPDKAQTFVRRGREAAGLFESNMAELPKCNQIFLLTISRKMFMRFMKWFLLVMIIILMAACATSRDKGLPLGVEVNCPDGKRQAIDCRMAFEQFKYTLNFDIKTIKETQVGFGLGVQPLINLDSITGDLLAHLRQVCIEYNNCLLTREEYVKETKYLREAQAKIRKAASSMLGFGPSTPANFPLPTEGGGWGAKPGGWGAKPKLEKQEINQPRMPAISPDMTEDVVLQELDNLDKKMISLAEQRKILISKGGGTEAIEMAKTDETEITGGIQLEYSITARRKIGVQKGITNYESIKFYPGATLRSGDQLKIHFITDNDGFVYVINFDSSGKVQTIFPHPEVGFDNKVRAKQRYELPPLTSWYFLDEVKGKETMYIIATRFPVRNLDALLLDLKKGEKDPRSKLQSSRLRGALDVLTRGIGGVISDPEDTTGTSVQSKDKETTPEKSQITTIRIDFNHQ
jgi:hypothetical protein